MIYTTRDIKMKFQDRKDFRFSSNRYLKKRTKLHENEAYLRTEKLTLS